MSSKIRDYDYDPEPGNDFTYDDHGNVIYGRGHIGAPRLPFRQYGMNVKDFLQEYLKIEQEIRTLFFKNPSSNVSDEIKVLTTILNIYEEDKDKDKLEINLNKFVRYCLPNERRTDYLQIKYFIEILKSIKRIDIYNVLLDVLDKDC